MHRGNPNCFVPLATVAGLSLNSNSRPAARKECCHGSQGVTVLRRARRSSLTSAQIPNSGKNKKSALIVARANKARRAVPTPHPLDALELAARPAPALPLQASSRPSGVQRFRTVEEQERDDSKAARFKLESRFLRLPLELLHHHRVVCATEPLVRPIPESSGVLRVSEFQPDELEGLSCPKRPKWSYNSTKKEVEKNEEGVFAKWLKSTDDLLGSFSRCALSCDAVERTLILHEFSSLASTPAPTFFERNLNVWRQLWRVSEASAILLILIDVRFRALPVSLYSGNKD